MTGHTARIRLAQRKDRPGIEAMHFLSVQSLNTQDYTPDQIEAFVGHLGTYDPSLIDDGTYFVIEEKGSMDDDLRSRIAQAVSECKTRFKEEKAA